jgi:hypothetical protein
LEKNHVWTLKKFNVIFGPFARRHSRIDLGAELGGMSVPRRRGWKGSKNDIKIFKVQTCIFSKKRTKYKKFGRTGGTANQQNDA